MAKIVGRDTRMCLGNRIAAETFVFIIAFTLLKCKIDPNVNEGRFIVMN